MYRHVLIPTDGTALSQSALEKGTMIDPAPMRVLVFR